MSNYTQGDWKLSFWDTTTRGVNIAFSILGPHGSTICSGQSQEHLGEGYILEDECQANARLIAAAPSLLDACSEWLRHMDSNEASTQAGEDELLDAMRAAIAKALGEVEQAEQIEEAA